MHPGLVGPQFPEGLEYLFCVRSFEDEKGQRAFGYGGWFGELSAARTSNGFGMNPLSYAEILAWATLTRRSPAPVEVSALRRIDSAFLTIMAKRDG